MSKQSAKQAKPRCKIEVAGVAFAAVCRRNFLLSVVEEWDGIGSNIPQFEPLTFKEIADFTQSHCIPLCSQLMPHEAESPHATGYFDGPLSPARRQLGKQRPCQLAQQPISGLSQLHRGGAQNCHHQ
jgi:hypothetical protein